MADDKATNPETSVEAPDTATPPEMDRLPALEAELADHKDRLLRAHAEMENLRRRTAREITDARQYAVTSFAREILAVADNLRRALDTIPAEKRAEGGPALPVFAEGVEVTERELLRVLGKHGVKPIEAAGQKFDPHLHQAMFEVEDVTVPVGTVVQVLQPGYAIGERVLRPAMVGVSKGGAKPEPKPAAQADSKPAAEAKTEPGDTSDATAS